MLTIGIPTYRRRDSVINRVREMLALKSIDDIEILVIDNGSDDGTLEGLRALDIPERLRPRVQFLENERNIGYARNFCRLFLECRTEFLLVVSDEDCLIEEGLDELIAYVSIAAPDFVSPRALIDERLYRGRNQESPIKFGDHESASFYISGLCFRVSSASRFLPWLQNLVATNAMAEVYPQTVLASCLVATGEGVWVNADVSRKVDDLDSHIRHENGAEYFHLSGRYEQFRGAIQVLDVLLKDEALEERTRDAIEEYRSDLKKSLFKNLRQALQAEDDELKLEFDKAAIRFYLLRPLRRLSAVLQEKIRSRAGS
jgi:glycosyltransferase involved in cell wall biosynthesis